MEPGWRIELFGGLRAVHEGRAITRFRTLKSGELLAYLAHYRQRPHPREVLIELLWPECDLGVGRNRLSTTLSTLRHQLEPPGVPLGAVLQADRVAIRLNPAMVTTDVAEFETALRGAESATSSGERLEMLSRAVALYQGPLLSGYYEDWVLTEQERLAGLSLQALLRLAAQQEQAGDLVGAIDSLRRVVGADPLREEAHRELIRLFLAAGQPFDGQRQYQELERLLKQELGSAPSPATRVLAQKIALQAGGMGGGGSRGGVVPQGPIRASPSAAASLASPPGRKPGLPRGTVTFLLTDIKGSTALWERTGDTFRRALAAHHELLRREFRRHGGHEVNEAGDAFLVAFAGAREAMECAVAAQRALGSVDRGVETPQLLVRMVLHTGDVELEQGEYRGIALHRASRMVTAAHGGQILGSEATASLLGRDLEGGLQLTDLGVYRLRDVPSPERLFQVNYPGMPLRQFPPLRAEAGYAGNVPPTFSRFFGREAEIARVVEMLAPEQSGGSGGKYGEYGKCGK